MSDNDKEQIHALSQRILINCARKLGGATELARHLGVSERVLAEWLSGRQVPPVEFILKAISPLLGERAPMRAEHELRATKLQ